MAAIASLLGIVDLKKADGIVLATDQVPTLLIGGGRSPLTMPPMSASMVESALAELLTPELRAALGSAGHVETRHTSGNRGTFDVRVRVERRHHDRDAREGRRPYRRGAVRGAARRSGDRRSAFGRS